MGYKTSEHPANVPSFPPRPTQVPFQEPLFTYYLFSKSHSVEKRLIALISFQHQDQQIENATL